MIIKKHTKKSAFTLSEVLITLVIIGVIAAITVPTVMQNTERQEFTVALKKANSVLRQALYRISIDNGYPIGDYEFFATENFMDDFSTVTNAVQKCDTPAECFGSSLYSSSTYKLLNNNSASGWIDGKSIVTPDGIMYTFIASRAIHNIYGLSEEDKSNAIGRIIVDVNGQKKPNKFGIDTFIFYLVDRKGIVPAGSENDNTCKRNNNGAGCAAKVLRENGIKY